jgi:hypothetical protein
MFRNEKFNLNDVSRYELNFFCISLSCYENSKKFSKSIDKSNLIGYNLNNK